RSKCPDTLFMCLEFRRAWMENIENHIRTRWIGRGTTDGPCLRVVFVDDTGQCARSALDKHVKAEGNDAFHRIGRRRDTGFARAALSRNEDDLAHVWLSLLQHARCLHTTLPQRCIC